MPVELKFEKERKFLIQKDARWREHVWYSVDIRQLFIPSELGQPRVRLRLENSEKYGKQAFAISKQHNPKKRAVEVKMTPLDYADAEAFLNEVRDSGKDKGKYIEKTRHFLNIPSKGKWCVDEFHGELEGQIIAEHEVIGEKNAHVPFVQPSWIGEEVSHDRRFSNYDLAANGWPDESIKVPMTKAQKMLRRNRDRGAQKQRGR
jgi:adenylate cyclase